MVVTSTTSVDEIETSMSRAGYEIHAAGNVRPGVLADFEGVTVSSDPVGTTIIAELADEAELHGILDALRREGHLLLDVRRDPAYDDEDPPPSTGPPRGAGDDDA